MRCSGPGDPWTSVSTFNTLMSEGFEAMVAVLGVVSRPRSWCHSLSLDTKLHCNFVES